MTVSQLVTHISNLSYAQQHLRQEGQGYHLVQLLQMFRGLKATKDRDQVFAFYGLARGSLPAPDYECTDETVFLRIARWLLENCNNNLLMLAMELRSNPRLPSWVPDWSSECPYDSNAWRRRLHCLSLYNSAKGIECSIRFADSKTLCLVGVKVDTVADVVEQTIVSDDVTEHAALIRLWRDFACSSANGQHLPDSFCKMLIEGCKPQEPGRIAAADASDVNLCRQMLARMLADDSFDDDSEEFILIRQNHLAGLWNRKLFRTAERRLLGLGTADLVPGDHVYVLGGGRAPFILRQIPGDSEVPFYMLIGHAYIDSLMDGDGVGPDAVLRECRLV